MISFPTLTHDYAFIENLGQGSQAVVELYKLRKSKK